MREIKFRGREQDGFWTYGDLQHEGNITGIIENGIYSWVDSSTVGQFTGLTDSDGKEIYEGDILRYLPPWRWVDTKKIGIVVFQNYGFYVKNEYVTDSLFNIAVNSDGAPFEVIGNIHDNPELLGVEA